MSINRLLYLPGEDASVAEILKEYLVDTLISKAVEVEEREENMDRDEDLNVSLKGQVKVLATVFWMMDFRDISCGTNCRTLLRMQAPFRLDNQETERQTHIENFFSVK